MSVGRDRTPCVASAFCGHFLHRGGVLRDGGSFVTRHVGAPRGRPPRFNSSTVTPNSDSTACTKPTMRSVAAANESSRNTCEPIVAVQAREPQASAPRRRAEPRAIAVAVLQSEPELRVRGCRSRCIRGCALSTPGVTRTSTVAAATVVGELLEPLELVERVDDDAADSRAAERGRAARPTTCCCRGTRCDQPGTRAWSATWSSPPVADVEVESLPPPPGAPWRYRETPCLHTRPVRPKFARYAAPAGAQLAFVVHIQRCAEFARQPRPGRRPPTSRPPSAPMRAEAGQQGQIERRIGSRFSPRTRHHPGSRRDISSGALTPKEAQRVGQARSGTPRSAHNRAWVSSASSVITRQSR